MQKRLLLVLSTFVFTFATQAGENKPAKPLPTSGAHVVGTPYTEQKVVFDFQLDHPQKIAPALRAVRNLMKPLIEPPYGYLPEFLDIKVIMHGYEIATLARANYPKYRESVERMRFFASIGVDFRVCSQILEEFGYRPEDLYDFVRIVPSALTDIAHWQLKGYAYMQPQILERRLSIEEIR